MPWIPVRELIYNRAQTLTFRVPEGQCVAGPPGSPTFTLYDTDGVTVLLGPSAATRDTLSTTVNAASGPSQVQYRRRLYLTSTTGIAVDTEYLLESTGVPAQWVMAERVTATYLDLRSPLEYDVPAGAGSTLKSTLISVSLAAASLPSSSYLGRALRLMWTYRIGTTDYTAEDRIDYVLQSTTEPPLTYGDLEQMDAQLLRTVEPGSLGPILRDTIRVCWVKLRQKLIDRGVDLRMVANPRVFSLALYYAVKAALLAGRRDSDSAYLQWLERESITAIPQRVDYLESPTDTDRALAEEQAPIHHRLIRV